MPFSDVSHVSTILSKIAELKEAVAARRRSLQICENINEMSIESSSSALKQEINDLETRLKHAIKETTQKRNDKNDIMATLYAELYLKENDRSGIYKDGMPEINGINLDSSDSFVNNSNDQIEPSLASNISLDRIHQYQDCRKPAEKCKYLLDKDAYGYDSDVEYVGDIGHRPQRPIWPLLPTSAWVKYVQWYEGMFVKIMKERSARSTRLVKATEIMQKKDEKHKELSSELNNMIEYTSKFIRKYENMKKKYRQYTQWLGLSADKYSSVSSNSCNIKDSGLNQTNVIDARLSPPPRKYSVYGKFDDFSDIASQHSESSVIERDAEDDNVSQEYA